MDLERIADADAFSFRFDPSALDRLVSVYDDVVAPQLDVPALHGDGVHEDLGGDGLRFTITTFGNRLAWVSSADVPTYGEFHRLFEDLGLAEAVTPLIDVDERVVMYQGFFVVSDGVADATWHVDYVEGSNAYTLLTPLHELDAAHGHLWYSLRDGRMGRHQYRLGDGVLVGEEFLHSTEPHAPSARPRVLVSLTFGTDRMAHWPVLRRTIGTQSPFVVMPCGHVRGTCGCEADLRTADEQAAAGGAVGREVRG